MNIKIISGSNKIGGCVTEISTDKTRILIDYGENLPDSNKVILPPPKIDWYDEFNKPRYDALIITHNHGDHIGLINEVPLDIPVYVEPLSKEIYEILSDFTNKTNGVRKTKNFEFNKRIKIGNIYVTPYKTDHSAFNSASLLIEGDSKRIFHTGDYRANGRNSKLFYDNIKTIGHVDVLISEGTNFKDIEKENLTEEEIEKEAIKYFKEYKQVFILQASTNIDRIVSFYNASKVTNKKFFLDCASANITEHIKNENIPSPSINEDVAVWIPNVYYPSEYRKGKEDWFLKKYIYPLEKYRRSLWTHNGYVMLVKSSMFSDIKINLEKYRDNAILIYSMWDGYRKEEGTTKKFIENIESLGIKVVPLHTSGHADAKTMKYLSDSLKPSATIVIHTANKEEASSVFDTFVNIEENRDYKVSELININLHNVFKETYGFIMEKGNSYLYKGVKVISYSSNKFSINPSILTLNGKNYFTYDKNTIKDKLIYKDTMKLIEYGFKFNITKLYYEISTNKEISEYFIKNQRKDYETKLKKLICTCFNLKEVKVISNSKSTVFLLDNISNVDYLKFLELQKSNYDILPKVKCSDGSLKASITRLKTNLTFTSKNITNFNDIRDILIRRTNLYSGIENELDIGVTRGEANQEKVYEQLLMTTINNYIDSIVENSNHLFCSLDTPVQMEFEIKSSVNPKIVGRIDDTLIRDNTCIFIEVKYGTTVIKGSNGIHKHLLDLYTILTEPNGLSNILKNVERTYNENNEEKIESGYLKDLKYFIILGYNEESDNPKLTYESVCDAINDIYYEKIRSKKLFTNGKEVTNSYNEFIKLLDNEYDKSYNYNIPEFIEKLNEYIDVEIYLANENYTKFINYNDLLGE